MSPIFWKDDSDRFAELLSELANSLQGYVGLSTVVRRLTQQAADEGRKPRRPDRPRRSRRQASVKEER